MFEALFILTAVDAGTRVARFMLQDSLGNVVPRFKDTSWRVGAWVCTAIMVAAWGAVLIMGVTDPLGGINTLFPLFGIANQLLAAIALAVVLTIVARRRDFRGLWIVALRFPSLSPDQQHARVQVWSLELLAHAGISLRILGQPPVTGPVMLVANHISWLDIPVMHAARHCRFVSKSDVQGWPLIGTLATAAGTLYIERSSRRDALRMVRSMQEALERGEVLIFQGQGGPYAAPHRAVPIASGSRVLYLAFFTLKPTGAAKKRRRRRRV